MKRTARLLLILLCVLLAPAAAETDDPVAVRVGRVEYPLSLARYSYQSNLDILAFQGISPTAAEKQDLARQTLDHMVDLALIENKLIEKGRNSLTEVEETLLRSYAGNQYESLWQGFQQRVKDEGYDATEAQITQWLNEQGYTLDIMYQEALVSLRYSRIFELYCPDVTVTEEEVDAYLQETFVGPDREAYEFDIPRYEREILETGNESFFTPAGYRVIRQILLPYPQSVISEINALQPAIEENAAALEAAYSAAAEAVISGGDAEAARAEYLKQSDAYAELLGRVADLEQSALPLVKDTTDEIASRYASGESFDSLIRVYGKEAGADAGAERLFHPDSENWAGVFSRAVSALKKPGDITEPFVTELGIHIVLYQADFPSGVHELTEEERAALEASALEAKQMEILGDLLEEWREQYPVETHPELLL